MKRLKELRKKFGYTNIDMAHMLQISPSYYNQLENKKRSLYYEMAKKITHIFGMKPDELFYEEY